MIDDRRVSRTRYFVPDANFGWYVRGLVVAVVVATLSFGGILWWFKLGIAGAVDPAVAEMLIADSNRIMLATGIAVLAGAIFLMLASMFMLHRIVGPISRLKGHMQAIIDGGPVSELTFRDDDRFSEVAEIFNEVMRQQGTLEDGR